MFDSENEINNLLSLVGSIKTNVEKVSEQIDGAENVECLIKGISQMCEIANDKLTLVRSEVKNV